MKAMILEQEGNVQDNPLALRNLPDPQAGPGQVRIKVHACGVCRTDLHIVEGELPRSVRPLIPGHETVGVVDQVGPDVRQIKIGDRIGIAWLQQTCGHCQFCQSDRENLCADPTFSGYHRDGGYAEYALVSEAFAYPLPPTLSDEEVAPLLCAGIIGYRALRRSEIQPGQRLGLYGFGAAAHIAIQIAHHWGCSVYVCSQRDQHRALALQLGASWAGDASEGPPDSLHAAIMFAPAGELVPPALRALEKGGTLALAGIHMSPIPSLDYTHDLFHERTIRSVTANTKQDGLDLLQEAATIPIKTHTHAFPLANANIALQELKAGNIQGAGVLTLS